LSVVYLFFKFYDYPPVIFEFPNSQAVKLYRYQNRLR